jgi:acetyl esterase/lipase
MSKSRTASSHNRPRLGLFERIAIPFLKIYFVFAGTARAIAQYPYYVGKWPWRRLVAVSFLKAQRLLSEPQRKYITPTTGEAITSWALGENVTHSVELVEVISYPNVSLHKLEFGKPKSRDEGLKLFYIHGGGFANPIAGPAHLPLIRDLASSMGANEVYIPEYSLAPAHRYPTPHVQVVECLRSLLQHTSPKRIVLAGDSAGGNLVLSALAHMLTPSPYVKPLESEAPFRAAVLICPYTTVHHLDSDLPISYTSNAGHDYLSRASETTFRGWYQPKYGEVYAEPGAVGAEFWDDLRTKVDRVYAVAGDWEILRDDIVTFGHRLQEGAKGVDVTLEIAERAMHVECAVDQVLGIKNGQMLKLLKAYCEDLKM